LFSAYAFPVKSVREGEDLRKSLDGFTLPQCGHIASVGVVPKMRTTEESLKATKEELEIKVAERTTELGKLNEQLHRENVRSGDERHCSGSEGNQDRRPCRLMRASQIEAMLSSTRQRNRAALFEGD
jgi:hypothetical protein